MHLRSKSEHEGKEGRRNWMGQGEENETATIEMLNKRQSLSGLYIVDVDFSRFLSLDKTRKREKKREISRASFSLSLSLAFAHLVERHVMTEWVISPC